LLQTRKKDPGEKFPWKYLSKNKIGYWHNLNEKKLFKKEIKKLINRKE
jgi:N-acetylmuramoyl-L-alanine amidase